MSDTKAIIRINLVVIQYIYIYASRNRILYNNVT